MHRTPSAIIALIALVLAACTPAAPTASGTTSRDRPTGAAGVSLVGAFERIPMTSAGATLADIPEEVLIAFLECATERWSLPGELPSLDQPPPGVPALYSDCAHAAGVDEHVDVWRPPTQQEADAQEIEYETRLIECAVRRGVPRSRIPMRPSPSGVGDLIDDRGLDADRFLADLLFECADSLDHGEHRTISSTSHGESDG